MANPRGPSNVRNSSYMGKNPLLPPKSPFPSISPSYADYAPRSAIGPLVVPKARDGSSFHQRTSSESQIMEEQPSWLDELLNEPDTPVRKEGHRRSSSDSFAYVDAANAANIEYLVQDECNFNKVVSLPSWGSQDFEQYRDVQRGYFQKELDSFRTERKKAWNPALNHFPHSNGRSGTGASQEADAVPSTAAERQNQVESTSDHKASADSKEFSVTKSSASEADTKRAKQQFAQRSRVRKLQYIAELERNVQSLQAEGSEVSAELEFVNQQNLILTMENKALKQRLESLAQEQLIKYLEHEVLEREIGRLRTLYQQQQTQPPSSHRRSKSRDFDSQFANLSLKQKEPNTGRDSITGALRI